MKVKVEGSANASRGDCFKIGQAVAELRCSLHAASHELGEGDVSMAKTYLYSAKGHGRLLGTLHPDQRLLRGILRGVDDATKVVLTEKPAELRKKVIKLREATLKLRKSTEVYCGTPPQKKS